MKKEIEDIKKVKWKELSHRSHVPPLPLMYKVIISSDPVVSGKIYGFSIPWMVIWNNDRIGFYGGEKQLDKASQWLLKEFVKPDTREKQLKDLTKLCAEARSFARKKTTDKFYYYKELTRIQGEGFLLGMVTWFIKDLYNKAKEILNNHQEELLKNGYIIDQALAEIMDHGKITDYIQKQKAIDKIAKRWSGKNLKNNGFKTEAKKFLEKYNWIGYDYTGPLMSFEEVVGYIKEHRPSKPAGKDKKGKIFKICGFDQKEKNVFSALSTIAFMKDLRNATDDFIHYHLDLLFKSVAKELKVDSYDLRFLWSEEFEKLLKNQSKPKIYSCKTAQVAYLDGPKNSFFLRSNEVKNLFDWFESKNSSKDSKEIKGMIAWSGKIIGTIKIVRNFEEMSKVKEGDILVSPMTSPRIINAMHKASAIITDEGGLTCHAAIISREMKKPCVVGTKIATKVLKDGDLVEVDANRGIVKILKN